MKHIGLNQLELSNNDILVRKCVDEYDVDTCVVVPDTHQAMLIKDGVLMQTFEGGMFPLFDKKAGFIKEKKDNVTVELVYVSRTAKMRSLWGTRNQYDYRDPLTQVPIKVGANGEFEVQVQNARKFYMELVGAEKTFNLDQLRDRLIGRIMSEVEPIFLKVAREKRLSFDRIGEYKKEIAAKVFESLSKVFSEEYGIKLCSFNILNVLVADEYIEAIENARMELTGGKVMRTCPKCGKSFEDGANFCPYCGERVAGVPKKCAKCGKDNPFDACFCMNCGEKL